MPQILVLNDCGIDQAGSAEDLKKKCNTVKELDLAQNKLENWNEVIFPLLLYFYIFLWWIHCRRVTLTYICSFTFKQKHKQHTIEERKSRPLI